MTLHPNQKIKQPHAPANRETVAYISAKYCIYRWSKTEHTAWCEENFDEFLRVPRIDEPKINIHGAVHRSLVSREQPFRLVRMIKYFVQRVGTEFAAEHRKENAAAENRIDEFGRVAGKPA